MPDRHACALASRGIILMMSVIGVCLSIVGSINCEFLLFSNSADQPWPTLQDPFDGVIEANVGMFSYQIVRAAGNKESEVSDECVPYEEKTTELDTPVLVVSQISAFCAPILAVIGILFLLMELCFCKFFCSFLISSSILVVAAGAQAATFAVYAEQDFCYASDENSEQICELGKAGIYSGVAAVLFWCSGLLVCCMPRPDPICCGGANNKSEDEVVVPIVVDDDEEEEEAAPPAPTRKNSNTSLTRKNSNTPLDSKIRNEDFDTPSVADGMRVEIKEREFPDGTRQVDEITHYADGSKSVKTQTFKADE